MPDIGLRDHLLALETSLVEQPTRSSRAHLEQTLAPEFFEFGSGGQRLSRQQIIDALVAQPPSRWRIDDFELHELSPSLSLVTFSTVRQDPESGVTTRALRSSIWRSDNGVWRLVFHQGTRTV